MTDNRGIDILSDYDEALAAELEARRSPEEREARAKAAAEAERLDKIHNDAVELGLSEIRRRAEAEERQPHYDEIDRLVTDYLGQEIAIELERSKPTKAEKLLFADFRVYCDKRGHRALPADPQPVIAYLISEQKPRGAAHVVRARRAIAKTHRAIGYPDPCDDLAVKALIRMIGNKGQPEKGK